MILSILSPLPSCLGCERLRRLVAIGRDEKLARIGRVILANKDTRHHFRSKVGLKIVLDPNKNSFNASYTH